MKAPPDRGGATDLPERDVLERAFQGIERRLQLEVRLHRSTRDIVEARRRGGSTFPRTEPFRVGHLVRSLVKSRVPVEHVFDIVTGVAIELAERGYHATTIDSVDLINTVDYVLKQHLHDDAHEWAHEYHNRYGWAYEFTTAIHDNDDQQFVRTSDLPTLAAIVEETMSKIGEVPALQAAGETDETVQDMLDRDLQRLIRMTSRSVRATGLHTVSRALVTDTAREIANWAFSSPPWTTKHRQTALKQVSTLLVDVQRFLAVGDTREAERCIDDALRITTAVLAQRFNLWIGLFDSSADAIVARLADRLRVAERIQAAAAQSTAEHKFYGGAILKKLDDIGLDRREVFELLSRIIAIVQDLPVSADRDATRLQALDYAEQYRNWVTRLIDETESAPRLDDEYFRANHDVAGRQAVLNRIVRYIVNAASLTVREERAHNFVIEIPATAYPLLSQHGYADQFTMICIAAGRTDGAVSLRTLQTRLRMAGKGPKAVVAPNGITEDARTWLNEQQSGDDGVIVLVDADALRGFISLPTEFMRMLELAAKELLVTRPEIPPVVSASTVEAFERSRRLAAGFYHQEALHGLAVECERFISSAARGWLIVTHGPNFVDGLRDLVGGRSLRLDLGTSMAVLKSPKARAQRREWLERLGVADAERVSQLPAEIVSLLDTLKDVRNRSAHGATRAYVDDYLLFRDQFLQFLRHWARLEYWPQLIQWTDPRWGAPILRERVLEARREARFQDALPVEMFVFSAGASLSVNSILHTVVSALKCAQCHETVGIETWTRPCEQPCGRDRGAGVDTTTRAAAATAAAAPPAHPHRHVPVAPASLLLDRVILKQLLDALESAFLSHDDFAAFCDESFGVNPENFRADKVRIRWKSLIKHVAMHGREAELLERLTAERPKQPIFADIHHRLNGFGAPESEVRSAWAPEVERGIPLPSKGRRVGLFVGLDRYGLDGGKYPDLRGCVNDARDIYDTFRRYGALGADSILLVDDAVDVRAARESGGWRPVILRYLEEMLASVRETDLFCFFFAGHGDARLSAATGRHQSSLIVPVFDGVGAITGHDHLLIDEVNALFRKSRVGSSLKVYDCCHAGQDQLRGADVQPVEQWLAESVLALGDGHCALAACDVGQVARERHGRGVMSKAFGEALRGKGTVGTAPTRIDALTAISQTCRQVSDETNRVQLPRYESGGRGELILTAVMRV